MVKVNSKKFAEFISAATLGGRYESCVLEFKEDGLHIPSKNQNNVIFNMNFMPKESFESYDIKGKNIGIKSSMILLNTIKSFNGDIDIKVTDDLIVLFKDKKKASIKTANTEYLDDNYLDLELFDKFKKMFDPGCKVDTDLLLNARKNMSIVSSEEVSFSFKNNKLDIVVGSSNGDKISEQIDVEYNIESTANFNSEMYISLCNIFKGNVNVSMPKSHHPVLFTIKSDDYNCKVIMAPTENVSNESDNNQTAEPVVEDNQDSIETSNDSSDDDLL